MVTQYTVTAEGLNIREGPSIINKAIGTLKLGEMVKLISVSGDGLWFKVTPPTGKPGWVRNKYLAAELDQDLTLPGDPPWMAIASNEVGVKEYPGNGENPRIVEYLRSTNLSAPDSARDETPWCSAFANWCVEKAGYAGTDSAWARSWLNWGSAITKPRHGCIVVLQRNVNNGHVGFYLGATATGIRLLGGNQSNEVKVSIYKKSDLLGYRLSKNLV